MPGLPVFPVLKIAANLLGGLLGRPNKEPEDEPFTSSTFRLGARKMEAIELDVKGGWSIEYAFSSNHEIGFLIRDLRGAALVDRPSTLGERGKVKAMSSGTYTLLFDNEKSVFAGKTITCEYRTVR